MSNIVTNKSIDTKTKPVLCLRCGRIIFENIKTGHTGCLNTKCAGYLWGSKNLDRSLLRQVKR